MGENNAGILTTLLIFFSFGISYSQSAEITVISPNGGETWEANSVQTISWKSSNVSKVKLEYSLNGGYSWNLIEAEYDASVSSYSWKVADAQSPEVMIKISNALNPLIFDTSDKPLFVFIKSASSEKKRLAKTTDISSTPVRIMPLGDSITEGTGDDSSSGYRKYLSRKLTANGYNFQFVGSLIEGLGTDYDRHHEGHGGWEAYFETVPSKSLKDSLNKFLTNNPADVVLLHIGTNDLNEKLSPNFDTPASLADEVRDLLNIINTKDHNTSTIVAQIINAIKNSPLYPQRITAFNDSLPRRVDSLTLKGRKVKLVDMESALTYTIDTTYPYSGDLSDSLHPNDQGYWKMADVWYNTLTSVLPILQAKIYLQGAYDSLAGNMRTDINSILPSASPYPADPVNALLPIPGNITDWVLLEIRSSDGTTVVKSKSCFLRNDGVLVDPKAYSPNISLGITPGNYYAVIKHRNHLAVMSSSQLQLNGITNYNFTTGSGQFFGIGGAVQLKTGVWGMIAGDANSNGAIDAVDKNNFWRIENGTSWSYFKFSDFNLDGNLDAIDKNNYWRPNNGKSTQVP